MSYREVPEDRIDMPGGIPYIVGNELAERFSYYGMKTILVVFMTHYLKNAAGALAPMRADDAKAVFHLFAAGAYFFPLLGAVVSDVLWGKYRTIIVLSLVYCAGHLALALNETRIGLMVGLSLIALGSGGIKPCVTAHVGDQFGPKNQHLLTRVYNWFYFAINFGSFFSTLLTPELLVRYGSRVAFGVPGALMLAATLVFWLGRDKFAHIPPAGAEFRHELFSKSGLELVSSLVGLILFIAVFWSLSDQTGSAWVIQAERMDLHFLGVTWLPSQVQAANPVLVLILIPLTTYALYPWISKVFPLTPLRKIAIGFFLTAAGFGISAFIEARLDGGVHMNIGWQFLAYVVLTLAEVLVYGTGLEFFYTQAPNHMKSLVMGLFLLSVSIGNAFTALVNVSLELPDGSSRLSGSAYYLFFAGLMLVTSIGFVFYASRYRERRFVQGVPAPVDAVAV